MSGLAEHNHSRTPPATERGPDAASWINWANAVTSLRLGAVPVAVWLTLRHQPVPAASVFVLAGVSDAVDGWLARRWGGSALGAVLDPLADKALLVGMFLALAHAGVLPVWLAALAVGRDALIVAGLLRLWRRGVAVRMRPLAISKLNTALQLVLVAAALVAWGWAVPGGHAAVLALIAAVAATTVLSGAAYLRLALR